MVLSVLTPDDFALLQVVLWLIGIVAAWLMMATAVYSGVLAALRKHARDGELGGTQRSVR